jgi:hypothetical protein
MNRLERLGGFPSNTKTCEELVVPGSYGDLHDYVAESFFTNGRNRIEPQYLYFNFSEDNPWQAVENLTQGQFYPDWFLLMLSKSKGICLDGCKRRQEISFKINSIEGERMLENGISQIQIDIDPGTVFETVEKRIFGLLNSNSRYDGENIQGRQFKELKLYERSMKRTVIPIEIIPGYFNFFETIREWIQK